MIDFDKQIKDAQISPRAGKYIYVIPGDPVPLARPRFAQYGRVFDAQKREKMAHGILLASQHGSRPLFKGPVRIELVFYFKPAQSMSKVKRAKLGIWMKSRPDIDNCIKYSLDISNGILFDDDAIVCSIEAVKHYDDEPRTILTIWEL